MLVLVEGGDGSGKTTLVNSICAICEYNKLQIERFEPKQKLKYMNAAWSPEINVADRSFISELVYRLCDDEDVYEWNLINIAEVLCESDIILVYCETDTQYEDSMARGEDNITTKKQSDKIKKMYNTIIKLLEKFTEVPIYRYNWKTDEPVNVIKFIMKEANK